MYSSAMEAAADGIYMARVAIRAQKLELNEVRDNMLTDTELEALLDAYSEAGR